MTVRPSADGVTDGGVIFPLAAEAVTPDRIEKLVWSLPQRIVRLELEGAGAATEDVAGAEGPDTCDAAAVSTEHDRTTTTDTVRAALFDCARAGRAAAMPDTAANATTNHRPRARALPLV